MSENSKKKEIFIIQKEISNSKNKQEARFVVGNKMAKKSDETQIIY